MAGISLFKLDALVYSSSSPHSPRSIADDSKSSIVQPNKLVVQAIVKETIKGLVRSGEIRPTSVVQNRELLGPTFLSNAKVIPAVKPENKLDEEEKIYPAKESIEKLTKSTTTTSTTTTSTTTTTPGPSYEFMDQMLQLGPVPPHINLTEKERIPNFTQRRDYPVLRECFDDITHRVLILIRSTNISHTS